MMQNVEVEDALSSIHHNITEVCFLLPYFILHLMDL